jgi:hypothetical protein
MGLYKLRVALAALAAIGLISSEVAMAVEEPAFELLEKSENIEMRQYRPVIVAETFVDGDLRSASINGFRLIADYIFGNNQSMRMSADKPSEKIAMTAPVSVEPVAPSERIAMTASVNVEPQRDFAGAMTQAKRWRIQFTMPGE